MSKSNSDIFMIGDTKLDLIAAQNSYITGIGVLCGYGKLDELKQYSDIVVTNSHVAVQKIHKL